VSSVQDKLEVFDKILCVSLLPHANVGVQHYQARFQSGKSTTDRLFALRQILEKCNEFNITTHHLFIDFKATYDTIIRNEVYVCMSEPNFPTKLIPLTKATLTIMMCCVKIQNDCSKSFEARQGLRQGDVLFTLLFNVVLMKYISSVRAVRDAYLAFERDAAEVGLKNK
jgi:hypothetical protein